MGRRVLIVIGSTLLGVVLVEAAMAGLHAAGAAPGFFRTLDDQVPAFDRQGGPGLYYAHPYAAYEMKPGTDARGRKINEHGFRGPPLADPKPDGMYRIVALGGSTTFGIYDRDEGDTYPRQLERILHERGREDAEVVNAGLVSATSAETLVRFLLRVLPLEPDALVIYHGFNDVPPRLANGFRPDYAHFRRVLCRSTSWVERRYTARLVMRGLGHVSDDAIVNRDLIDYTWHTENLPDAARMQENFDRSGAGVFERNIESVIQVAAARGIDVVLMTFAFNDALENWTPRIPDAFWGPGIEQHNEVIRELAKRYSLPLVPFAEAADRPSMFRDSIHLSPEGNALRARLVADALTP